MDNCCLEIHNRGQRPLPKLFRILFGSGLRPRSDLLVNICRLIRTPGNKEAKDYGGGKRDLLSVFLYSSDEDFHAKGQRNDDEKN